MGEKKQLAKENRKKELDMRGIKQQNSNEMDYYDDV